MPPDVTPGSLKELQHLFQSDHLLLLQQLVSWYSLQDQTTLRARVIEQENMQLWGAVHLSLQESKLGTSYS